MSSCGFIHSYTEASDPLARAKESYQLLSKNLNSLTRSQSRLQRLENRTTDGPCIPLQEPQQGSYPDRCFSIRRLNIHSRMILRGVDRIAATLSKFEFYLQHHVKPDNLSRTGNCSQKPAQAQPTPRYLHYKQCIVIPLPTQQISQTKLYKTSRVNP